MIIDHIRDLDEFKKLYERRPMPRQYDFNWLVKNPHLFCFYDELTGKLRCFITIQREDGELTLSGTSVKKNYQNNIDAINAICDVFKEDIFAYTPLKHAALLLKNAGFEKVDNNKYIRRYKDGQ